MQLPDPADVFGRVTPGTIQGPVETALGRVLREEAGPCSVALSTAADGLELSVSGAGAPDIVSIPLTEVPL